MIYRGADGRVAQGGDIVGSPLVQGAVVQGASQATFDGAGFKGVFLAGDTFTVAGDAQQYTVSADAVVAAGVVTVQFTPAVVPAGGWADNAAVSVASNKVAGVTAWELSPAREEIETTEMGAAAKTFTRDIPEWTGSINVMLDYGDPEQAALIDAVRDGSASDDLAVTLVAKDGRMFYGAAQVTAGGIASERGALVNATLGVRGSGLLHTNWDA